MRNLDLFELQIDRVKHILSNAGISTSDTKNCLASFDLHYLENQLPSLLGLGIALCPIGKDCNWLLLDSLVDLIQEDKAILELLLLLLTPASHISQ